MRLAILLTAAVMAPASAQLAPMKQAPAAVTAKPAIAGTASATSPVPLQTIAALEKEMDRRLSATGGADPCAVLGETRGLYESGLGAVFTAEVELTATPGGIGLFQATVGPDQKAKIHKNKLEHVPLLEQTMRDMVLSLAATPTLKLSDADQVVVAVRLVYRPWEDMTGLPGQIVMRLDHRGGIPKMEVQ
jgi:hypothetical protein